MKNNIKRIISFALMLSLLVGMMAGFSAFAAETETENVEIVSKNVYFGETLNLMYAVESTSDDVVVNVYNANHELVETIKDYTVDAEKNGTDAKVFVSKIGVPAQDIDTEFYAVAVAGNAESATAKYSVLEYLYERLYVSEGASAEQKAMYNSLLAYADAADVVVNEDTTTNIAKYAYVRVTNGTVDGTNTAAMVMAGTALNALTTTLVPANGMKLAWTVATDSTSKVVEAIAEYTVEAGKAYTLTATEVEDEEYVEEETFVDVTTSVVIGDYATANGWENSKQYLELPLNSIVTATAGFDASASNKNSGKYYLTGNNWRFYLTDSGTLTISAGNYNIVSVAVTFTYDKTGTLNLNGNMVTSGTVVNVGAPSVTFTVGDSDTEDGNGNVQITKIEVVYQVPAHDCQFSAATCTAPATCSVCGKTTGDKLPHSYDDGVANPEATCKTAGIMVYTCACGDTKSETIEALGHTTTEGVCERCNETVGGTDAPVEKTETLNIYANKGTMGTKVIAWTQGDVTVSNAQASSSSAIRTSDSDHFRVYASSELTISATGGSIKKIEITCTSASYANVLKGSLTTTGATATVSGSVVTVTVTAANVESILFTMTAQTRINKVVVTYAK